MKTTLALLIVTAIVATTAFGVARSLRSRPLELHDTAWLRHELKLTDAQTAEVAKLEADFQKSLADCCAAHCAARAELAGSLADATKAADCCARMCAAQNDSEKVALDHILRVRALLTPKQQKRYTALIQQQLTGPCTMRIQPATN
ncbi:MAG: periplasmic heavy metal sensor [Verrucomicrobia bacterium]|nr:periplasmic heavy metal sensor [Verrucomicrobiota bacterium]